MVDTGCLCFSIFDESLVGKYKISSVKIALQILRLADRKATVDVDGRQEKLWGYVMPNLAYPINFRKTLGGAQ